MKQLLKNLTKKTTQNFLLYTLGLILNKEKKTCTKIAGIFGISHDRIYRILNKTKMLSKLFPKLQISLIKHFSQNKKGYLIIDDTAILKPFSNWLPGVWYIFDTIFGRAEKGFRKVVLVWSNGNMTIPLDFNWFFSKNLVGDKYENKTKIAKQLILFCLKNNIKFRYILFDAHYSTIEMMNFLQKMRIKFVAKIACNRKVEANNGIFELLKVHPLLKLSRNERSKKMKATYYDMELYFSVHKRKNKNGEYNYVYIVSNINLYSKTYLKIYEQRWEIEKVFRTIKQLLGLNQCFSRSLEKQETHIKFIFFAYSFLENEKNKNTLPNPESAAKLLRELKMEDAISRITSFSENFQCFA